MFPPDDAAVDSDGGGAGTGSPRDAGKDAGPGRDAGRDAGDAGDAATDATVDGGRDAALNHAPVATSLSVQTDEDTAQSAQLPASDEDGDPLSFELVDGPDHGTLTFDEPSGEVTYTPSANFHGNDSFTFQVNDGTADSSVATVSIQVLPVNDAPVATGAALTTDEDNALTLTLIASDVDGDTLSYTIVDDVEHGLLSGAQATRIYTPDANFNGSDGLSFRVSDGTAMSATVTVTIEVTARNDAPSAVADAIAVAEGATATTLAGGGTDLRANDSDLEPGSTLAVTVTPQTAPAHGTLELKANGTFSYEHDGSETSADSFVYEVCDNGATPACATATVAVTITPVDDAPMVVADAVTVTEGGTVMQLMSGASSVLANDSDAENEALTVTLQTTVTRGTLTLNADGTFSYTHDGSETSTDSFVYQVCDAAPAQCATASVMITVTAVNEAPVAVDDAIALDEATTATTLSTPAGQTSVTFNDTDPDGNTLVVTVVDNVDHGTLTLNANGSFSYAHNGDEVTSDSFSYQACDGATVPLCDTATVAITVTLTNDAPVAVDDTLTVAENGTATTVNGAITDLLDNDTDAENDTLTLSTTAETDPAHGSVTLNADGTFSYVNNGDESASDGFDYEVCDPTGCDVGHVAITVTPVNDAPVAVTDPITVAEGGTATTVVGGATELRANDADAENDTLTVTTTPVASPAHGVLMLLNANGEFSYAHDGSENFSDSFEYEVCDGSACDSVVVNITITALNEAPTASAESLTVDEDGTADTLTGGATSLLANASDPDGDTLTAALETQAAHGMVTINPDGTFLYTHDGSETPATDSFQYEVCDDDLPALCAVATVSITINAVNDAPVAGAETITVLEGGVATALDSGAISVMANDTDAEGGTLVATLTTPPAHASGFSFDSSTGTFAYTHDGGEDASDSFVYTVCDDVIPAECTTQTVNIIITAVNDAPVANNDVLTVAEGGFAILLSTPAGADQVSDNDVDNDGDTLSVELLGPNPANGTLTLNPDGTFRYEHVGDETTSDSFSYEACDPSDDCSTATVTIMVTPVNDPPVAADHAITMDENGTATMLVGGGTDLRAGATDIENDALSVEVAVAMATPNGSVTLNADGTFSYVHNGGETIGDGFDFRVCDASACDTGHVTITIAPVNDPPVAVTDTIAVSEGATATMLANGGGPSLIANDTDAENDPLTLTTTVVSGPAHATAFALNPGVGDNGTFSYTHDGSETLTDTFTYEVCDPTPACSTVAVSIVVTAVNEQPVALGDSFTVNEAGQLIGAGTNVIANDSDPDGDALDVTLVSGPAHASSFALNADGTFQYTHDGSETPGSDSFVYELCDDDLMELCTTATVTITINAVNDAPTGGGDIFTVIEGGTADTLDSTETSVLANDSDGDDATLTAVLVTGPAHASAFVLAADGEFSYTHDDTNTTSDSFTYNVCDDELPTNACTLTTVTIVITPTNDPPVAVDDVLTVAEGGTALDLAPVVLGNDTDLDADPLTVTLPTLITTNGTLAMNGSTFSYTHNGSETLSDGFDYLVCDDSNECDTGHVTITVTPVNDPPSIIGESYGVNEGATLNVPGATGVLSNDSDVEGGLSVVIVPVTPPANASSFTLNADGSFSYTHDGSETLIDGFVYRACDGGGACANASVVINVTATNDAPTATADATSVAEGGSLGIGALNVLTNDSDVESDALFASPLLGPSNASSFTLNANGTVDYTHNGGETTSDSFTYAACEVANPSVCSASTTVTITVTPVDDPPNTVDDVIKLNEGGTATTLDPSGNNLLANDTDPDSGVLTATLVTGPNNGTLTLGANGTFSYTHNGTETTSDSFTYRACTTAPAACDPTPATVTIEITLVNDAPVGGSYAYNNVVGNTLYTVRTVGTSDSSLLLGANDTDAEAGSVLSVSSIDAASAQGGTVTSLGGGGFSYLPPTGYLGPDNFHYRIADNGTPVRTTDVTVNLTVGGPMVWYVDDDAPGGGTGRSTQPFNSLASADSAAAPIADTRIYVAAGTYGSAISLVAGQTLHGAGDFFQPSNTVLFPAGTRPLISTALNAVTITSNNVVRGINVTTTGSGTAAITGATSGASTINNGNLTAASGSAIALSGTGSVGLSGLGISGRSGIVSSSSGTLSTLTSGMTVTGTGGPALDISAGTINLEFSAITSTNSASYGVRLAGVTGTATALSATATTVSNPTSHGITISGASGSPTFALGNCTVTQSGTAPGTSGDAYAFATNSAGTTISLAIAVDPNTDNGRALFADAAGTVNVATMPLTMTAAGAAVIDLRGASLGNVATSGRWQFNVLTSVNSAAEGIKLFGLTRAVTVTGATTITNPLLEGIRSDNTAVDLTFADVTVNTRRHAGIFIENADNSLVTFANVTIPNPNAITTQNAFVVQNSNADVSVTGGATITAAVNAIRLLNNGGGSFTLNAAGGALNGGGLLTQSTGSAVLIDNCTDVSIDDLVISNPSSLGDHGIDANTVDGFVLRRSTIDRIGNADVEHGVSLSQATGTVLIDDVTISRVAEHGIEIVNSSGSSNVKILSPDITNNDAGTHCAGVPCGGYGISIIAGGTSTMNALIENGMFGFLDVEGIQTIVSGSATLNVTVRGNTFNDGINSDSAIELNQTGGTLRYDIDNNTVNLWSGNLIVVATNLASGAATMDGFIRRNLVNANPVFGNIGINVLADLSAGVSYTGKAEITGNTVNDASGRGIQSSIRGAATGVKLHTRVMGNLVDTTGSLQGYFLQAQAATSHCVRVGNASGATASERNNAIATFGSNYALNRQPSAVLEVEGSGTPDSAVDTGNVQPNTRTISAGVTLVAVNSCLAPTAPTVPP